MEIAFVVLALSALLMWIGTIYAIQRIIRFELMGMMGAALETLEKKSELQAQVAAEGGTGLSLEEIDERTRSLVHLTKMNHEDILSIMNHLSKTAQKKPAEKAAVKAPVRSAAKNVKNKSKTSTKQTHMSEKTKKNGSHSTCN